MERIYRFYFLRIVYELLVSLIAINEIKSKLILYDKNILDPPTSPGTTIKFNPSDVCKQTK